MVGDWKPHRTGRFLKNERGVKATLSFVHSLKIKKRFHRINFNQNLKLNMTQKELFEIVNRYYVTY